MQIETILSFQYFIIEWIILSYCLHRLHCTASSLMKYPRGDIAVWHVNTNCQMFIILLMFEILAKTLSPSFRLDLGQRLCFDISAATQWTNLIPETQMTSRCLKRSNILIGKHLHQHRHSCWASYKTQLKVISNMTTNRLIASASASAPTPSAASIPSINIVSISSFLGINILNCSFLCHPSHQHNIQHLCSAAASPTPTTTKTINISIVVGH